MTQKIYTILFTLSIVLINPIGSSRGSIWTQPKCVAIALITALNLYQLWQNRSSLKIPKSFSSARHLWELYLFIGLISTLLSPFPELSLFGQDQMGDGFLYWILIATFTLSNTLLLTRQPQQRRSQLHGLLIGGTLNALATFPQLIDWRIDYTATSGKLLLDNVLVSTIFQNHQPIGFYSHRGHAAFVLAATLALAIASRQQKWLSPKTTVAIVIPVTVALLLANTRMAIAAAMLAIAYLCGRKYKKLSIAAALICLLLIAFITTTRQISGLPLIRQIASDRIYLWKVATRGIAKRPLFGWGFDGFGIAYPYVRNPNKTPNVVRLGNASYDVIGKKGKRRTLPLPTYKAHNLVLDTTLSVGVLGSLSYAALWGYYICLVLKSPERKIFAVAIATITFTLTWFECAQFTHIAWWSLSSAVPSDGKN